MSKGESAPQKIYTRTGDKGKTSLIGGARVSKAHLRLDAYGTIDELNSVLGVLRTELRTEIPAPDGRVLDSYLNSVQNDLFNVGSQLACEDHALRAKLPGVHEESIAALEHEMDEFTKSLAPLRNFILPGGSRSAGFAHIARTVCRRAERICVALADIDGDGPGADEREVDEILIRYINRLSDFLFVLARHLNRLMKIEEPIWSAEKKS